LPLAPSRDARILRAAYFWLVASTSARHFGSREWGSVSLCISRRRAAAARSVRMFSAYGPGLPQDSQAKVVTFLPALGGYRSCPSRSAAILAASGSMLLRRYLRLHGCLLVTSMSKSLISALIHLSRFTGLALVVHTWHMHSHTHSKISRSKYSHHISETNQSNHTD
jgi:hypothetical protein